jgi:hypothetical protein
MKLKPSAPEELVAKIEYMLAADVILSESDGVFLESLLKQLRSARNNDLSKASLGRLERIFESDKTRRVYRVKASNGWHPTPSFSSPIVVIDPFADIGKKVRRGRRR